MKEEKLDVLRQKDVNLRDALRLDEAELPQMPADLNERLMQRVATQEEKKPRRLVWPWIAAACVAGVMMIWLTPPKADTPTDVVAENKPHVEQPTIINKAEEPTTAKVETEEAQPASTPVKVKKVKMQNDVTNHDSMLLAQETSATETPATPTVDETKEDVAVDETSKPVTLTERDIPITRPENYQYTPEELALMKKQANEAYLKWVELELEIARHNLEQTAQK